jgi:hypothetical protein
MLKCISFSYLTERISTISFRKFLALKISLNSTHKIVIKGAQVCLGSEINLGLLADFVEKTHVIIRNSIGFSSNYVLATCFSQSSP